MMHIYNDIIERNDGESENNIIRGGMIMLRVDFTFDKKNNREKWIYNVKYL